MDRPALLSSLALAVVVIASFGVRSYPRSGTGVERAEARNDHDCKG